jgi:hypothetical protein
VQNRDFLYLEPEKSHLFEKAESGAGFENSGAGFEISGAGKKILPGEFAHRGKFQKFNLEMGKLANG